MNKPYNTLTPSEANVIIHKGTERPFTGEYTDTMEGCLNVCRQCDSPLYTSEHTFLSHCGWPSFDDEIPNAVKRVPDADGRRIEIVCANCEGLVSLVAARQAYVLRAPAPAAPAKRDGPKSACCVP